MIPKIVVVTPVKNEAWILERFLSVTSQFADLILIADQGSTDESVALCQRFPKATVIENPSEKYDEASRQQLLINQARDRVPEPKIILALDADEILAANALTTSSWQEMLRAKPGTVLCFEKPDLYLTTAQCIRYARPWPLGYVDDGAAHHPSKVHSIRIPTPETAPKLHVKEVQILHYALVRLEAQHSKRRMYCVLEHILRTAPVWRRRLGYRYQMDWPSLGKLEASPHEWFAHWEQLGIDMHTIQTERYYWQDYEVLRHFFQYGVRRFWVDNIWDFDWEQCRRYAQAIGISEIPPTKISPPPRWLTACLPLLDQALLMLNAIRRRFK
ncbi:MAG: glycosyltransferase family 2 protein [Acidobacteria bacterium]|nr:glycosyltransferase family 2 protein [Acidobacteriota bacterium]